MESCLTTLPLKLMALSVTGLKASFTLCVSTGYRPWQDTFLSVSVCQSIMGWVTCVQWEFTPHDSGSRKSMIGMLGQAGASSRLQVADGPWGPPIMNVFGPVHENFPTLITSGSQALHIQDPTLALESGAT